MKGSSFTAVGKIASNVIVFSAHMKYPVVPLPK
jgi:hypothetical protein